MAWSRDPSPPRQVTVRLRTPAPQLTEHCKDRAVSTSWSSPSWSPTSLAQRADSTLLPHAQFPGPERPSHPPAVTQPEPWLQIPS